jgi:hypothetical protein
MAFCHRTAALLLLTVLVTAGSVRSAPPDASVCGKAISPCCCQGEHAGQTAQEVLMCQVAKWIKMLQDMQLDSVLLWSVKLMRGDRYRWCLCLGTKHEAGSHPLPGVTAVDDGQNPRCCAPGLQCTLFRGTTSYQAITVTGNLCLPNTSPAPAAAAASSQSKVGGAV